jgi:uncharacterized protein with PQ loop repeat
MFHNIALIAGIILPFWNIPLIVRVIKRRSSADISMMWAVGVWACFAIMGPSAFISKDIVWRVYSILNFISFTFVVSAVIIYRKK